MLMAERGSIEQFIAIFLTQVETTGSLIKCATTGYMVTRMLFRNSLLGTVRETMQTGCAET